MKHGCPDDPSLQAAYFRRAFGMPPRKMDIQALPGVLIDSPYFSDKLPMRTTAVYFMHSERHGSLYIGKASDLRKRWVCGIHHRLRDAIKLGDVTLHWLKVSKDVLSATEKALILEYRTPWNKETERPEESTQLELELLRGSADRFREIGLGRAKR